MDLCSDGHGEICYESRVCPACQAIIEMRDVVTAEMQEEIDKLDNKIYELENSQNDI